MYHVFSTGIIALVLYLLSYSFSRTGFFSQAVHRKFWNFILALTFLITSFAGIFLALQLTYKWDIPFVKTVLKWHVETGIGLSLTGIFHFLWHIKYFGRLYDSRAEVSKYLPSEDISPERIRLNLFVIGITSTSLQLLMMREMMNIAGGYELVTGVFFGSWLVTSAAGASIARKSNLNDLRVINIIFIFSAVISILLMIVLSRFLLSTGETPSFLTTIFFSLVVLLPFCFTSGFAFIKLLMIQKEVHGLNSGRSFSVETSGGIVAGLAVSVLTRGIINTYQLILILISLFIIYFLCDLYRERKTIKSVLLLAGAITTAVLIISKPDVFFRQQLLPGIKVKGSHDTPYGNITTAEYGEESSVFYNHRLLSFQHNEIEREENIHYAMLQSADPGSILVISGDLQSGLKEILKYPVKKIFYIENDPGIFDRSVISGNDLPDILTVENVDAYTFVKETSTYPDVVILNLPPPSTLSVNRYYTVDFFREIKKKLNPGGVFSCSPGPGENYFNKQSAELYSSIYNSLRLVFENVLPIVGNKLYLIASDSSLTTSVCSLVEKKGIQNIYVSPDFLTDSEIERKSANFAGIVDPDAIPNTIEAPVACFLFQSYNLTTNLNEILPSVLIIILIFLTPVFLISTGSGIRMFSAAAALSGFEIIMLLVLQSTAGNMYQLTGLILASFMAGLALGARHQTILKWKVPISVLFLFLILLYLVTGYVIRDILVLEKNTNIVAIILVMSFVSSFATGHLFNILTDSSRSTADPAKIYSADLTGSALGFIAISGIILPILGIRDSIYLLSAIIFAGFLFGTIRNK